MLQIQVLQILGAIIDFSVAVFNGIVTIKDIGNTDKTVTVVNVHHHYSETPSPAREAYAPQPQKEQSTQNENEKMLAYQIGAVLFLALVIWLYNHYWKYFEFVLSLSVAATYCAYYFYQKHYPVDIKTNIAHAYFFAQPALFTGVSLWLSNLLQFDEAIQEYTAVAGKAYIETYYVFLGNLGGNATAIATYVLTQIAFVVLMVVAQSVFLTKLYVLAFPRRHFKWQARLVERGHLLYLPSICILANAVAIFFEILERYIA